MRRRRLCVPLVAAVAALAPHAHTAHALSDASFTPVNWSLVSSSAIAAAQKALVAPIGCACVETSGSECPFFDCACTCDLTAGACDAFCCCDVECAPDYVVSVKRQGLCVDSEPIRPSIEYCSTDLTLKSVATSSSGGVNPLLVDSVLCVAVDNNEVVGDYIATPAEQDMAITNAFLQNAKPYAFTTSDGGTSTGSSTTTRPLYHPGDLMPVFASTASATIRGPWLMGWGASAGSTRCTQRNPVRFGFDWKTTTCVVDNLLLDDACAVPGSVLDPSAIVDSVLVAVDPSVTSAAAGSKRTVAIQLESLREIDPMTHNVAERSRPPFPSYYPQPTLTMDASNTTVCAGALLGVAYTIYHNGSGLIEHVDAAVTIGNLSTAQPKGTVSIAQSFSVRFVSTAPVTRSLERGNVQTYERSGHPGFILHKPVRVGIIEESLQGTQIVSEMAGGLTLRGLGDCNDDSDRSTELPVLFGEDSHLSCSLTLNASAFKSFCERDAPVVADALRVGFSRVARFGNADPFLLDEWLTIDYDEPTKTSATFTDASGTGTVELTCQHVLSSLHIEFLVAPVGPVNNPQNKIIAARASHGKDDTWTFWKNARDPAKQETYLLTTTVAFVTVQTATLDQWIPPTPPIWFSIPNDVFYPFLLNASPRSVASPSTWTVVLWISTAALWSLVVGDARRY